MMKVCSKCHIEKDESEFYKTLTFCRCCIASYNKQYRRENRARLSDNKRVYYINNKEYFISKASKWQKENKDNRKEICKKHYANKGSFRQYNWVKENPAKKKAAANKYRKKAVYNLYDCYVKERLTCDGYTKEEISQLPDLLSIKKIKLLVHRIKLKNETK